MRILFALTAWGHDYVRDFLEVALPTLFAEGNIAAGNGLDGSQFLVLTEPGDVPTFQAHPLFRRLQRTLPTEFVDISRFRGRDKYRAASRCQMEALRRSLHFDAVILLYPDMIWCRNGIRFAVQKLEAGASAVFSPAPPVLPEATLAAVAAEAAVTSTEDGRIISIAPRNLAGIALRHHHPMWRAFDWDGEYFADYPSCLSWSVPNQQAWLIRCFHLHPVALRVQPENPRFFASFNASLDGEYVARLFDSTDGLAFADDTDAFAVITLRHANMGPFPRPGGKPTVSAVARWAEGNAFLLHRAFTRVRFRWHAGWIDEAQWQAIERRSDAVIDEIRDRLHTPDSIIRTEEPSAYQARLERRYNPAFKSKVTVELPDTYRKQPRGRLAAALVNTVVYRSIHSAKDVIARGPVGRWLRQSPTAIAVWHRAKRTFEPESELHAAASAKSLIRTIIAARR